MFLLMLINQTFGFLPSNFAWIHTEKSKNGERKRGGKYNSNGCDRMTFPEPSRTEVNIKQI